MCECKLNTWGYVCSLVSTRKPLDLLWWNMFEGEIWGCLGTDCEEFWYVLLCNLVEIYWLLYPEDGGSMFFRNVGKFLQWSKFRPLKMSTLQCLKILGCNHSLLRCRIPEEQSSRSRRFSWLADTGKVRTRTGHEGPEGEQKYSSTLSLTSALDGVGVQRHAPAALPRGMTRYPLYRKLGRPQGRSGLLRKISPPPGWKEQWNKLLAFWHCIIANTLSWHATTAYFTSVPVIFWFNVFTGWAVQVMLRMKRIARVDVGAFDSLPP
jgi:hypothetical protein